MYANMSVQLYVDTLISKGCMIKEDITTISSIHSTINISCNPCKQQKTGTLVNLATKSCRTCGTLAKTQKPSDRSLLDQSIQTMNDIHEDEQWAAVQGGWVSNYGKIVSCFGKRLKPDAISQRVTLGNKHQTVDKWVKQCFDASDIKVIASNNKSTEFIQVPSLDQFVVSSAGEVYVKITQNLPEGFEIDKLVACSFHPISNKREYDEYKQLICNHKDGDQANNHADNLEWIIHTEEKQVKKRRVVKQYENTNGTQGKFMREYDSIVAASKATGISVNIIREAALLNTKKVGSFFWRFNE